MEKIRMKVPLVEMDGDEMTRIIWKKLKDELILPYIDLKTVYFDLGLPERDRTNDRVTEEAAFAAKEYGVAVKCATITPNRQRVEEYGLHAMYKSPNATIRAILDGTVFRTPIIVGNIKPAVKNWKKPITIARHAFGDIYKASEIATDRGGRAELRFIPNEGEATVLQICDLDEPMVLQGQFNKDSSIRSFAHSCFRYALSAKQDLWFSTKDTISKQYDQTFKLIFQEIYDTDYRKRFEEAGITYFYTLIDDAVARVIRSEGGFIWACKNYDGDVMSDMVSTAFGSLAMMTSVLVSPDGNFEYEAAHGTVTKHYYRYLAGEKTSTNPVATLFAWTGALRKRGQLDGLDRLSAYADTIEKACIDTVESGTVTKDLALLAEGETHPVDTDAFIAEIKNNFEKAWVK